MVGHDMKPGKCNPLSPPIVLPRSMAGAGDRAGNGTQIERYYKFQSYSPIDKPRSFKENYKLRIVLHAGTAATEFRRGIKGGRRQEKRTRRATRDAWFAGGGEIGRRTGLERTGS